LKTAVEEDGVGLASEFRKALLDASVDGVFAGYQSRGAGAEVRGRGLVGSVASESEVVVAAKPDHLVSVEGVTVPVTVLDGRKSALEARVFVALESVFEALVEREDLRGHGGGMVVGLAV
jgi:hypothetical protein